MRTSLRPACLLLSAFLHLISASAGPEVHDDDHGLWSFVTRPDIKAPKWNVSVYHESAIAPGYWFFGPYETLNMDDEFGNGWIGPHIYAQDGTLIWSGAPLFDNGNIEDFRLSNVDGVEMMTLMDQRHSRGVFLDNRFEVKRKEMVNGPGPGGFNSHEFNFVENGTKALVVYTEIRTLSREETKRVGVDGRCTVACNGIVEYDVKSWKIGFTWSSCEKILLDESTLDGGSIENKCRSNWDYV